ncbi:MAG: pilus assembly PilX N-terminal domain-containing protein [Deltaproteobacteria bacterium]|nr:pilus assembly PilX N-terminal domain-containing protein [Deltaproteobacteria bacterium]
MGFAKTFENDRGAALVIALMFLAIVALAGSTAVILTSTDIQIGSNYKSSSSAFYNADAGVNFALAKMKAGLTANPKTFQLPTVVWDPDNPTDPNSFTVLTSAPFAAPAGFSFSYEAPGVTMIANNIFTFTAIGANPDDTEAQAVITATFSPSGLFNYGIFGDLGVTLSGNGRTDSYDSSAGPYTWATHNNEGDVGTNAITAGAISLSGNAKVYGDAMAGKGGNPATCVTTSGNAAVVPPGQKLAADEQKDMPAITDPGGGTNIPAWNLSGNSSDTLSGGTYRLPGISITANATGTISGHVILYVTGNINISGNGNLVIPAGSSLTIYASGSVSISGNGISNNTGYPKNLQIYGTSTCNSVTVSGNGNVYGAIYAPSATVSVTGNGDIYGSVIGRTIAIPGNGNVHYDEDLQNTGPISGLKLLTWKQES